MQAVQSTGASFGLMVLFCILWSIDETHSQAGKTRQIEIIAKEAAVREQPSRMYDTLWIARKGEVCECTGKTTNGWYQVRKGGKIGYVHQSEARMVLPLAKPPQQAAEKEEIAQKSPEAAPPEVEKIPPPLQKPFPWKWVLLGVVALGLYILYFIRNLKAQKELEDILRHKHP